MAKLVQGILGGFSGRVGAVVGYHRHGQWFVRAYQPHIRDCKSDAQLVQRSRFKTMIQFASQATAVLRVGFRSAARRVSLTEGNYFLKSNHEHFASFACGAAGSSMITVDYASLCFSQGSYAAPQSMRYTVDGCGIATVCWSAEGGRLTDRVHIFIYSPAAMRGIALCGERGARSVQALLPEGFTDGELHLWAFAEGGRGEVSATVYVATGQVDEVDERLRQHVVGNGRRSSRHGAPKAVPPAEIPVALQMIFSSS